MAKKPTIAQVPGSGKSRDFKATGLKQNTDVRLSASELPGQGKLTDFLKPGATPAVQRPSLTGKSTGKVPQNKRGGRGR
jgi:hypothetical protein